MCVMQQSPFYLLPNAGYQLHLIIQIPFCCHVNYEMGMAQLASKHTNNTHTHSATNKSIPSSRVYRLSLPPVLFTSVTGSLLFFKVTNLIFPDLTDLCQSLFEGNDFLSHCLSIRSKQSKCRGLFYVPGSLMKCEVSCKEILVCVTEGHYAETGDAKWVWNNILKGCKRLVLKVWEPSWNFKQILTLSTILKGNVDFFTVDQLQPCLQSV